jgi:hypothetical protein
MLEVENLFSEGKAAIWISGGNAWMTGSDDVSKSNAPKYSQAGLEDALVGSLSSCNIFYLEETKNGDPHQ